MSINSKILIVLNHAKRLKYAQDKVQNYDYFHREIYEIAKGDMSDAGKYAQAIKKLREILEI